MTKDLEAVLQRHEDRLMSLPNVRGVGIGERDGEAVIKVFVDKKVPEARLSANALVPKSIEGCPVDVEEIGDIKAVTP
jgi:hypothetical protein